MTKNVLITGGAGFIAHHVIERILLTTDWTIVSLDRLDYAGNLNRLADMMKAIPVDQRKRFSTVWHDLKAEINPLVIRQLGDVNIILHLAAGSHVERSIENPVEFVMDNVVGTANLLQYARTCKNLDRFIYFSTDEVFGTAPPGVEYDEYARYNSTNPYSASKAGGEELCVAFENTYNLPMVVTHTMNVFGERQHPEKFVPMVIQRVRDGEKVTIHSNPEKTAAGSRHYIHAKDVADGLMFILEKLKNYKHEGEYGGAKCTKFNLVGPEEINNLSLAQMIAAVQGKELIYEMVDFRTSRPGHDLRYSLSGKLLKSLGWEPKIKFSDRIKEVTNWSLENDRWLNK